MRIKPFIRPEDLPATSNVQLLQLKKEVDYHFGQMQVMARYGESVFLYTRQKVDELSLYHGQRYFNAIESFYELHEIQCNEYNEQLSQRLAQRDINEWLKQDYTGTYQPTGEQLNLF